MEGRAIGLPPFPFSPDDSLEPSREGWLAITGGAPKSCAWDSGADEGPDFIEFELAFFLLARKLPTMTYPVKIETKIN